MRGTELTEPGASRIAVNPYRSLRICISSKANDGLWGGFLNVNARQLYLPNFWLPLPSESATFLYLRLFILDMKRSEIGMGCCANLLLYSLCRSFLLF